LYKKDWVGNIQAEEFDWYQKEIQEQIQNLLIPWRSSVYFTEHSMGAVLLVLLHWIA
jgi:hypothetical protein